MEILEKPWQGTVEEVLKNLETSKSGLIDIEAQKRIFKFGANSISRHTPIPFFQILFDQFIDLLVLMLIFAASLSFLLGDFKNGIVISVIVVINAVIGFTQEYKAQKILKALNKLLPNFIKVKRGGQEKQINANYLIPGDIVLLGPGDKVPADIRLLESYDLRVDEKTLTGESQPQTKEVGDDGKDLHLADIKNSIFMGTEVTDGEALGVVVSTGLKTEFGKIAEKTITIDKALSPLQDKTHQMSKRIAILAAVIVIILVLYKYFLDKDILDAFIFSIAVAAALVPEGLPATISVALSFGANKLAKKKALVRNLVSVETLGSVTVICTDKTGTLTTGQMRVNDVWLEPNLEISHEEKERLFNEALILCNDAQIDHEKVGDPLEIALLENTQQKGFSIEKVRQKYQKVGETPFNSRIKYMSVTFRDGGKFFSYLKGAPEVLVEKCNLTEKEKKEILQKVEEFASRRFRVLAVAYNEIFLGLISIFDPPREEVKKSIEECRNGHIRIIMITGDNSLTASSIAKMVGITQEKEPQVIEGKNIDKMTDIELRNVLLGEPIFARTLPEHKFRIVDNLMKMGEVVSVTGDGVNDAPALKRADIGVAMGKIGTDVSREAADMVLLDDNFATIVSAIKEGRVIFDNIKKFLFYIFSHNFGELLLVLSGMVLGLPLPLLAIQILAIDLGTDVLPSMALIFEPPEHEIMKTKPRSRNVQLLTGESFFHLTILGLITGIGGILNFIFVLKTTGNYTAATTASLVTIVMAQFFNVFVARCPDVTIFKYPFWRNKYLILAQIFTGILVLAIVYWRPLNEYISTSPLPLVMWWRAFIVGLILLIVEEIYKFIRIRYIKAS